MTTERITTVADVYQFVERLKAASQQSAAVELNRQLDHAMRSGSSGLEILGAIRQTVVGNLGDIEHVLGPDGRLCADQVVAFVDRAFGQ